MAAVGNDEYEPVRVPRPEGVPEWGVGGAVGASEDAPLKGSRKEDRWV
jgi:cytochrome c oxidase assembly protein subunit 16